MAKGLSAAKAKKILQDGYVKSKPLTAKQKKYFGAIASGATPLKAINGGWLDKFAMGGSLPGASGMMYSRNSGSSAMSPPNLTKAQGGEKYTIVPEDGIQLNEVVITGKSNKRKKKDEIRKELLKNMPNYLRYGDDDRVLSSEQQQQLNDLGITDVDSYNEYFGTDYSNENAGNEFNYLNYYKPQYDDLISSIHGATNEAAGNILMAASFIPSPISGASLLSKTPQAYRALAGPLGQAYKYTANSPVGKAAFKYIGKPFRKLMDYKPGKSPFSIGNYADMGSIGYGSYNIGPDVKELYDNPSWSAAGNVGLDALSFTPLLNKRFTDAVIPKNVRNITKYYTNPLGDAFKIGNNPPNMPTWLTRGKTPPNKLLNNSKMDADNFMQSWTNPDNPSFVSKFDDQIMKPFSNPAMSENYLRVQTQHLNGLKKQYKEFVENTGSNVLPKAKALQNSITELENNINGFWKMQYPTIARDNMKAIQAGKFETTYSTTGFEPGSGGTYYPPSASRPLNTWKYNFPNQPNTVGVGNNSVVKLREVPVGATEAVKTEARTSEMLTGIHETLGHASNAGGAALTKQTNELIRGALKPNPKIKDGTSDWVKKFLGPKATFKDWTKYLQDETEMVARVMELRRQYIPKEFWGTSKQYQVDNKLIDQIFRDGLSGKSKIHADFFRVIDKKGLQKLMKGLYATIPMAMGADGLLEYKHGGNVPKMKNGGWLDKFQEGGVIEDDRGQWAYPGKITKINSNKITMKGVNYPVLGISDTGDKKMMQPGKDYKFGGNSVTEYPMAQEGAGVNKEGVEQYKWFKNYMRSPKYTERLKKEFPDYSDNQIGQEVKARLNNVMQTRVGFLPRSSEISPRVGSTQGVYNADEYPGAIMLRPEYSASTSDYIFEPGNYLGGYGTTPLHEWSHAADDGGNKIPQSTTDFMLSRMKENTLDIPKDKYYYTMPTEYLGRMQPLRYLMKQEGLYDAGKQDFTKEDLEKAKQNKTIKNNRHFKDLMENVNSDEDFIELMNKVASVNQKDKARNLTAQDGLKLKKATPSFPYINRVPDTSPQVEFLKNWTNSPRGQELLSNSFDGDEKDIERVTSKRINNLDNVDISMDDHASDFLGRYSPGRHDIKLNSSLLDTSEPKQIGNQDEDVILHELSHAQDFSPGAEFNRLTMPFSDQKLIKDYRKKTLKETKNLDVERKFKKDLKKRINYIGDPTETRARLNSIRYFYETSPIGKEEGMPSIMDSEVTPEMMEIMKDNAQFKELREVYDDDEILELLNTISDNSKPSGKSNMRYAKQGRSLEKKPQLTNFTNYNTPQPVGWLDKY